MFRLVTQQGLGEVKGQPKWALFENCLLHVDRPTGKFLSGNVNLV